MPCVYIAFADCYVVVIYQCALYGIDADDTVATVDARQRQLFHARLVKADAAVVVRERIDLHALDNIVFWIYVQRQVIRTVATCYRFAFFVDLMCAER